MGLIKWSHIARAISFQNVFIDVFLKICNENNDQEQKQSEPKSNPQREHMVNRVSSYMIYFYHFTAYKSVITTCYKYGIVKRFVEYEVIKNITYFMSH